MSVRIVPFNPRCGGVIEDEGVYCFCRRRNVKDIKTDKASRGIVPKEKLTVDLGPHLKEETFTSENRFSVYINCGAVSVETKEYWDITVINSETPSHQYKTLTIEKSNDNAAKELFEGVFKILPPKQSTFILPPIQCNTTPKDTVEKKLTFRLVFQPEIPCMVYNKIFNIRVDKVPIRLKVRGFSQGPSVCLSQNVLNFGGIFLADELTLNVEIHNHSQTRAQFQFDNDNLRSVFQICPLAGTIEPMTIVKVNVTFNPTKADSFYKRVYCLIHHQDPQFLDLIGISVHKPLIFDGPILFGVNSSDAELIPFPLGENEEYFSSHALWGVQLGSHVMDFGFREAVSKENNNAKLEPLTLSVTSDLPYDTKIEWSPDSTNVFVIDPPSQILPANKSISFEVQFRPGFPESFYDGNLECYVYPIEKNWSEEGPPWIYAFKKKQMEREKSLVSDEDTHHHKDTDVLITSHSVALKENLHHDGSFSKIQSVAIVKTEIDSNEAEMSSRKTEVEVLTGDPEINSFQNPLLNRENTDSHAHFFHHQHLLQTNESNKLDEVPQTATEASKNLPNGTFEMEVHLFRLNGSEPVIFTVDPVGDATYVIPLNEEEVSNELRSQDSPEESLTKLHDVLVSDLGGRKWSRNTPLNPGVSKSVLRKPGTENFHEAGVGEKFFAEGDNLGLDISTMMPSVDDLKNDQCLAGAGDGMQPFGLPNVLALPLCISVKLTGHTFPPSKFAGIPDISLPTKALMYTTLPFNPVCRSLIVKNNSDLPCYYNLDSIDGDTTYQLKPAQGLIPGKCHQIILLLLNPYQPDNKIYTADCNFKVNLQDNCKITLVGCGEVPALGIQILYESSAKGQEIVCLPTIPGCSSKTFIELENRSGFHYRFWLEPADWTGDLWKSITPEPANGYIAPYEKVPIAWMFTPEDELTYYVYWRFCFNVIQARSDSTTACTDYEFIIPLTGAGKHGHLSAEPSFLDFDLVPIFETQTKTFNITNHGAAAFTVNLIICHEQWLRDFSSELITVSPNAVTLTPHQSVSISVTVRPSRANIQNFYIIYEWDSSARIDNYSKPKLSDINNRHLVDITFMGDHVVFKATDITVISRHPIWDAQQCWSMFSMDMLNELLLPYSHTAEEGTLPVVSCVTFRLPPAPVGSENSVFQMLLSNTSDLKGYWEFFTTPPKNWRKFVGQKELNSKMVFYDGHFKDSPDLLSKLWANKFGVDNENDPCDFMDQKTSKEQYRACLSKIGKKIQSGTLNSRADMEVFQISHTSGHLNNKDTQVITFKYSFEKVGYHEMSILLRIYPAIFVWIDLSGRTLDIDQPYLQPMYKYHMYLHPVSAADIDPPVQMFWLYNGGNVIANFTVDLEPFEALKEKDFDHAVIECLTATGVVRPKSWFAIKLRFSPLEYADYSIPLRIIADYSEKPIEVIVTGVTAINAMICLRPTAPPAETRSYIMYDHSVPLSISPPHIAIPHFVPTGHKVTSCVFLTNLHTQNCMFFRWPEVFIEGGGSITFQPDSGRIPPRGEKACLVIIQAGKVSATFSTMIRCMIEDENEKVIYEFVLDQWNKEQAKINLLDSKTASVRREIRQMPIPPQPFSRLLAVSVYIGSVFGLYDSIPIKERSRIAHPQPISIIQPLPDTGTGNSFTLSKFEHQLSEEIISDIIWDMVQGPAFESFVRSATRRNAPLYEEYKESEKERKNNNGIESNDFKLPRNSLEEVLEATVYNLIQEISTNYIEPETREKWYDLPQVQPQAFVDVDKYKSLL